MNNLADVDRKRGNYELALSKYERAYKAISETLGPQHSEAGEILHNMGLVHFQLGSYRNAIELYEKALVIVRKEFGPKHYKVGVFLNNSGMAYAMIQDFEKAHEQLKLSLEILIAKLGKDHIEVADCRAYLGDVCMKLYVEKNMKEKLDEAREYYIEANRIVNQALGPEHTKCKQFASLLFICENFKTENVDNRPIEQINIILYDVSRSMTTTTKINKNQVMKRNEITKAFFGAFIDKEIAFNYPHAIGLITFGSSVRSILDITRDYEQFCKDLGNLRTEETATKCWDAIMEGISKIRQFKLQHGDILSENCICRILCLSDGGDNASKHTNSEAIRQLQENDIIFDCIPIEGEHGLMRGVANASGGFCFQITNYEQGLSLFEREAVLNLHLRDNLGHTKLDMKHIKTTLTTYYNYVDDPKIKVPEEVNRICYNKIPENPNTNSANVSRIVNEYINLYNSPLPQFEIYIDEFECTTWKIIYIGEEGTPYYGKSFLLYAVFGTDYPNKPPNVRFLSDIFHVNVNTDGKICHEILTNGWQRETTMRTVLENIAVMFKFPNPLNALDSVKGSLFMENKDQYYATVIEHTARRGLNLEILKQQLEWVKI